MEVQGPAGVLVPITIIQVITDGIAELMGKHSDSSQKDNFCLLFYNKGLVMSSVFRYNESRKPEKEGTEWQAEYFPLKNLPPLTGPASA
jgi:hypothetical protein